MSELTPQVIRSHLLSKSDQMNYEDVAGGPIIARIMHVKQTQSDQQPWAIALEGQKQPYKPCLTMRRVIVGVWGDKVATWLGRSLELYADPSVLFKGVEVGGIRIRGMSHIDGPKDIKVTAGRGSRISWHIEPLELDDDERMVKFRRWLKDSGLDEQAALAQIGKPLSQAMDADWAALRAWAKKQQKPSVSPPPNPEHDQPFDESDAAAFERAQAEAKQADGKLFPTNPGA